MKRMTRLTALLLVLMMGISASARAFWPFTSDEPEPTPAPAFAPLAAAPTPEPRQTDESALLRVYLKSLGDDVDVLSLTLCGLYSVEQDGGFRFARDTELAVVPDGKDLLLSVGGLTINMGSSFTLTRHAVAEGEENGIIIRETGRETLYLGDLTLKNEKGSIQALVTLDVEDYLYGVVPYEMSDSFPIEALKAQAVAARTFAMSRKSATRGYDVVDTTADQVFRGFSADHVNAIEAVDATRGVVGLYKDKYATCYFTASNGGQTAMPDQLWGGEGDYGWLDVRDDPYDVENPSSPVKSLTLPSDPAQLDSGLKTRLLSGLTEAVAALGYSDETEDIRLIKIVSVQQIDPKFGEGNRMFRKIRVGMSIEAKRLYAADPTPNAETTPMNAPEVVDEIFVDLDFYGDLKPNYGLKISGSDCEIASVVAMVGDRAAEEGEVPDSFVIESRRFGHGVGMSQRGAQQMAREYGALWTEILAFYYPGMTLVEAAYVSNDLTSLDSLPTSLGNARPRPTPKPTPAPLPALEEGEYYAIVTLSSTSGNTLNVRDAAGIEGNLLGTFDKGQRVIVVEEVGNGWAKVKTVELSGYSSMDYLTRE